MKITKSSIKKLVTESLRDMLGENATISENADNDRVIEEMATAALGAIMNFGDFELERLIPDAGDRAEFTNKFKSGVIKDLKQFSELPPLDRRLPPLERLDWEKHLALLERDPRLFKRLYRVPKPSFDGLVIKINARIHVVGTPSPQKVPTQLALAMPLRYLAGGSYLDLYLRWRCPR